MIATSSFLCRGISWLKAALLIAALALAVPLPAEKRIAFSFDDVPRREGGLFSVDERTRRLIRALRKASIRQAGFFVTPGNLLKPWGQNGEARIRAYVRNGHVIANHSYSHMWLSKTSAPEYVADMDRAAAWLKGRRGYRPWFRFPYLDEGGEDLAKRLAVRSALAERGLRNGYVTVDNYDWQLDNLTKQALDTGKPIDDEALRQLYVETLVQAANFYDALAQCSLSRQPAQVILLHETDLNAKYIEDVARALRNDGWKIIPIDEAYRDPIALREPQTLFTGSGRVAAIAHERGMEAAKLVHPRANEEELRRLFESRVLHMPESTVQSPANTGVAVCH